MSTTTAGKVSAWTSPRLVVGRTALLVVAVTVAVATTVGGLTISGEADPGAFTDPGPLVRWGLPITTVAGHLAGLVTLGGLTLCAVVLTPGTQAWRRAAAWGRISALSWALLQPVLLVLIHASVLGRPVGGPGYVGLLVQFIGGIELGMLLGWAVVLTAAVALTAVLASGRSGALVAATAAVVAHVPLAGLGHSGSAADHELAVSAMWLHLLGISWWVGGLVVLSAVVLGDRESLPKAARRYSVLAGWAVALVVFSGAANASVRVERISDLATTLWGQLVVVKVVAVALLGVAGWVHRRATIPLVERTVGRIGPFIQVVIVEVLVMSGVVGISVVLGSTAPPVPQADVAADAGMAALPEPWFIGLLTQWSIDPLFLFLSAAGALVYLSWVGRLRQRGDQWPVGRTLNWLVAMVLSIWVVNGGPGAYAQGLFSVHMLQHMALISVLPVFLVQAAPVSLALRALPRRADQSWGPRELLLGLVQSRWAQFFAHPVVASLHVPLSMALFYFTPLFELALRSHVAHVVMMVHFGLVGYLFTNAVIGVDPGPRRPPYPVRLILLLPSTVFHTFFGLLLLHSTGLLAGDHFTAVDVPWAAPVPDQQAGGALAWAMGEIPVVALAVIVAQRWAVHDEQNQQRRERRRRRDQEMTGSSAPL